jgi:mitochondrial fission protein ELM1
MTDKPLQAWIITNGNRGNEVLCEGVAERLKLSAKPIRVHSGKFLAPYWPAIWAAKTNPVIKPPWPELLLASSRLAVPYARYIRRASGGKTFTVFLHNPRISPSHFDLVWAPEHDQLKGENVVSTLLSPHRITQARLAEEAKIWRKKLAKDLSVATKPILAVMIGGPNDVFEFGDIECRRICQDIALLADKYFPIISLSRRSPASFKVNFEQALKGKASFIYDGQGENPYPAMLGLADHVMVTSDSTNMLSEACAAGKPISVIPLASRKASKFQIFVERLIEQGLATPFDGSLNDTGKTQQPPRDDTDIIAARIKSAMMSHE